MRHWLQLATRNWRAKPGRAVASVVAIALGVGTVISITNFYESVRRAIADQVVTNWLGRSHLIVEPPLGHWGQVDQALAEPVAELDNVAHVTVRLKRILTAITSEPGEELRSHAVEAVGIDPETDPLLHDYRGLNGRPIKPGERNVAIVDRTAADAWGVGIGEVVRIAEVTDRPAQEFRIIGIQDVRRIAMFQRPTVMIPLADLQELKREPGRVNSIQIMLNDTSPEALEASTAAVQEIVQQWNQRRGKNWQVSSARTKLEQLQEAERVTRMVLTLVAFVALLTSFFIILTTMSMGLIERISIMGMLRCVGITRGQLGMLLSTEVLPVGVIGVVLGVPAGLGLTWLGAVLAPEYVQGVAVSAWGLALAVGGGLITTVGAAGVLLVQVARISPMEAANPEAKPARIRLAVLVAVIGGVLLVIHQWMIANLEPAQWFQPLLAFIGVATLYLGYVLLAPLVVWIIGTGMVHAASVVMGVRPKLARDQVGRSPWRSAAVCWMLMVGLSLIVYIGVRGESVTAAWDFPKRLPSTFVWDPRPVPRALVDAVEALPAVSEVTVVSDIKCKVGAPDRQATSFLESLTKQVSSPVPSTYVAGELDTFLDMTKLGFLQGDLEDTVAKLQRGGYVILPPESAKSFNLGVGDKVTLSVGSRSGEFEVAAVVESPALDIAVSFFQADSYMMLAAAGSFLGTLDDARRVFGIDDVTMFMMNVGLPPSEAPDSFNEPKPPRTAHKKLAAAILEWRGRLPLESAELEEVAEDLEAFVAGRSEGVRPKTMSVLRRYAQAVNDCAWFWSDLNAQQRWDFFREQLVLRKVAQMMGRPNAITGSLRSLKDAIDKEIRDATLLMSAVPAVALVVAALGVMNLMMVNVTARSRQIAVIRAVGGTRGQIVRLVLAEGLTLGLLGSVMGVALGLHAAASADAISSEIIGFATGVVVPWARTAAAILLTVLACLIAGAVPARYAARNNIVDAMAAT